MNTAPFDHTGHPAIPVPRGSIDGLPIAFGGRLLPVRILDHDVSGSYDWGYRTEPEAGMEDRRIAFPRGRVCGGSSAINAMTFNRGDRRCVDRWLAPGNTGWGDDDIRPTAPAGESRRPAAR